MQGYRDSESQVESGGLPSFDGPSSPLTLNEDEEEEQEEEGSGASESDHTGVTAMWVGAQGGAQSDPRDNSRGPTAATVTPNKDQHRRYRGWFRRLWQRV